MLDEMKRVLIGQVIEDVGLVNVAGVKHARLILSDSKTPLLCPVDNVMITTAGATNRKPVSRSLTATPLTVRIKAS